MDFWFSIVRASATDLKADDVKSTTGTVETDIGAEKEGSRTDSDTVKRYSTIYHFLIFNY